MLKQRLFLVVALFLLGSCTSDRSFQPGGAEPLPVTESRDITALHPTGTDSEATGFAQGNQGALDHPLNQPPEISKIGFVPEIFMPGDLLGVEVSGYDADDDEVTFAINWTVNGEEVTEGTHCTVPLSRGDKVTVRITPYDGMAYGQPIKLEREIINFPPQIQADEATYFDGTLFQYQVKATDPDGDRLTYSLRSAPPGMNIVSSTGQIKWLVPEDFTGVAPISILVEDGQGGKATYDVKVNIQEESASL